MQQGEATVAGAAQAGRLRIVGICVVAAIDGFRFGFDTAVINGGVSAIQHQFNARALPSGCPWPPP